MMTAGERRSLLGAVRALALGPFTRHGGDAILLGETRAVVVVVPGDDRTRSGVRQARTLSVLGELPERLVEDRALPIDVLLRVAPGEAVFLGPVRLATYAVGREATFEFIEPLSRELLALARPPAAAAPRASRNWMSLVERDPIAGMQRFIAEWHGPLAPDERLPEAEVAAATGLPDALAALYRQAGHAPRVLSSQNQIRSLSSWTELVRTGGEDGWIPFYEENQGVFVAFTRAGEPNPEVVVAFDDERRLARERLSGFLLQAVLFEAVCGAPYTAMASCVPGHVRDAVVAPLSRLPLGAWRWPGDPGELWCGDGVIAFVSANDGDWDVLVGSLDRARLSWLADIEDAEWDTLDA